MKIKEILRKGSLIEILHEENNIFYQTNIKDLMEDALAIGVPASGQERLFMQEGTKWLCRIKIDSTFQYFSSTVVRRAAKGINILRQFEVKGSFTISHGLEQ